jgi:16S rRNA (uracil1498-N3)-methyltransferase
MARRRFFVDAIRGGAAELRGEEARRLTRVLRAEPGQRYEITDSHQAWLAEIAEARGDWVVFRVIEPAPSPEAPVRVTLAAALIKFDRLEWMIEKVTELGVERILPFEAARSEKGLAAAARNRTQRWRRIAKESSQQSRRLRAPEILPPVSFEAALAEPADYRYWLEEAGAAPLAHMLPACRTRSAAVGLLTGPEGGWTGPERELALAAGWQPVSLGPRILRAETAAIAAMAMLTGSWI